MSTVVLPDDRRERATAIPCVCRAVVCIDVLTELQDKTGIDGQLFSYRLQTFEVTAAEIFWFLLQILSFFKWVSKSVSFTGVKTETRVGDRGHGEVGLLSS